MAWWPTVTRAPMSEREARIGMQHRALLDVAAGADRDRGVVAARDRAGPYAGVGADPDVADQRRLDRDVGRVGDLRGLVVDAIEGHVRSFVGAACGEQCMRSAAPGAAGCEAARRADADALIGPRQLQHAEVAARPADQLQAHRQAPALKPAGTLMHGSPAKVAMITTSIQRW